jgi:hypothetical protein
MTDFNLSNFVSEDILTVDDIKEFIKLVTEDILHDPYIHNKARILLHIKFRAGEKLV